MSVAAILLGVPGSDAGLRFVEEALSGNSAGISVSSGVGLARSTTPPQRLRKRSDADAKLPARETPTPTSADATPSSPEKIFEEGTITDIILNAAAAHGVSGDFLYSLAMCESTLNPNAYNPAGYHGLFQFDFQTWAAFGEGHIYDPEAQAQAAAELISAGETDRWPNCP